MFFSILAIAASMSLDGLGVGMTYGLRKIKISIPSVAVISLFSTLVLLFSMQLGKWIQHVLSPEHARIFGGVILIVIGLWGLFNVFRQERSAPQPPNGVDSNPVLSLEIKGIGFVIQVLKSPTKADVDHSGILTGREAVILGAALSCDAFGAGIGASLLGLPPLLTALTTALLNVLFLLMGLRFGDVCSEMECLKRLVYLPGCILILFGILKMI